VLAHQGGWDEVLFVLVPIGIVVALLTIVKARLDRAHPPERHDADDVDDVDENLP
jgi:hypothetical protein